MIYKKYIKRILDFTLCAIALIVVSPLLIIAYILVKIDSPGPFLFMQDRFGKDMKIFRVYKIRTMTHKVRETHNLILKGNSEVTRVGYYLRRLKFDELPQLFNVLKGEMAIVGPRPCLPSISDKFNEDSKYRFEVLPGLTSLAAIKGSIFLSWDEKWYYDRLYVQDLSFVLDIKIILYTVIIIFVGEEKFLEHPKLNNGKKLNVN